MQENSMMYEKYKKTSVETASPGKLLLMLYDEAIKNLEAAIGDIGEQRVSQAHSHIVKAQDILFELRGTLNMEYSIADSLGQLYDFLHTLLVEANIHKDRQRLEQVRSFLAELRETWQEALHQAGPARSAREQTGLINITG